MKLAAGHVAVVTGGASGIGLGMAKHFASNGMRIVLADIEVAALDAAVTELSGSGAEVIGVQTDVSQADQITALADRAYERFGAVNIVCNNAGVVNRGAAWELSLEDWEWVIGVDLWSVIHGVREFLPRMLEGGEAGHIVNTASMAGLLSFPMISPYDVAKSGVVALSEALWHELHHRNAPIGVSVLCPGLVATRIGASARNKPGAPPPAAPTGPAPVSTRNPDATAMQPSEVAQHVAEAIESEQFWILTHPAYDDFVRRRAEGILDRTTVVEPQPL